MFKMRVRRRGQRREWWHCTCSWTLL